MDKKDVQLPFSRQALLWTAFGLTVALAIKFFWPMVAYDIPFGYDPGFYRYLFLKHAEGFPPFWIVELEPWARGHPLGLFFFTTIFIRLGVPADWFIGWIWNLFTVILALTLASVMWRKHGVLVALGTLAAAVLSIAYFDGFAAMYWKTLASLFWCVLAFRAMEKRSWLSIPFGIFTVTTHHQTGLLFGLVFITWLILPFIPFSRSTESSLIAGRKISLRDVLLTAGAGLLIVCIGLLAYLPILKEAVLEHLPTLLGQTKETASGSFPSLSFYLRTQGVLIALGIYGLVLNIRKERWTLWQISVLWCAAFVLLRLIFYRRFFLQLDFFLLPFAGMGMADLWMRFPRTFQRSLMGAALLLQLVVMQQVIVTRGPLIDKETFNAILDAREIVPENGYVLALENESAVVLRGWMADRHVAGPGLFESTWTYTQWERFLVGTTAERSTLFDTLPRPAFVFVSPLFHSYYGEYSKILLSDPCLRQTSQPLLYTVVCAPSYSQ